MKDLENKWTTDIAALLVGKKITKVRYMTEAERDQIGWDARPIVIILDDGTALYPSQDDEGNNAGSIFTNSDSLPTIPVF
jgi:hypothetical protein